MEPQDFVLVVKTPKPKGEGHDFLFAHIDKSEFDKKVWRGGKSDQLILTLHAMTQSAMGRYGEKIEYRKLVRAIRDEFEVTIPIRKVELDFALPTKLEIGAAVIRWNRKVTALAIKRIEEELEGNLRYTESTQRKISEYRTFLKRPNILSGIRAHYERVLIADCLKEIAFVRKERKVLKRQLVRAMKLHAEFTEINVVHTAEGIAIVDPPQS